MKKYWIGFGIALVLFLSSLIYRQHHSLKLNHFPVGEGKNRQAAVASLHLYFFFSQHNCSDCMKDFVEVLNGLLSPFEVVGVVPAGELEREDMLRGITGVTFPIKSFDEYRTYVPWYTPTLIGVSPRGKILFTLPAIAVDRRFLDTFLANVYERLSAALDDE